MNCIGVGRVEFHRTGFFDRAEITFSDGTRTASSARNVGSERVEVVKREGRKDHEQRLTEALTSLRRYLELNSSKECFVSFRRTSGELVSVLSRKKIGPEFDTNKNSCYYIVWKMNTLSCT